MEALDRRPETGPLFAWLRRPDGLLLALNALVLLAGIAAAAAGSSQWQPLGHVLALGAVAVLSQLVNIETRKLRVSCGMTAFVVMMRAGDERGQARRAAMRAGFRG
jgi:hypothetical protein